MGVRARAFTKLHLCSSTSGAQNDTRFPMFIDDLPLVERQLDNPVRPAVFHGADGALAYLTPLYMASSSGHLTTEPNTNRVGLGFHSGWTMLTSEQCRT